jgi:hypothetical protein
MISVPFLHLSSEAALADDVSSENSFASRPGAGNHDRMSRTGGGPSGWDDAGVEGPPPAAGMRLAWPLVPAGLRQAVEQRLGERVVEAVTQPGGFSPGVAARLKTATGKRAFVKAVAGRDAAERPYARRSAA